MKSYSILYISIHEILEYDDLCMLTSAGHRVFSMGRFLSPQDESSYLFRRPKPAFFDYEFISVWQEHQFSAEFVSLFDIVIVNHNLDWLNSNLSFFKRQLVIYRTIGQSLDDLEIRISDLDPRVKVVRYSDLEAPPKRHWRTDAIIYFSKQFDDSVSWKGGGLPLTFHNDFPARSFTNVPDIETYQQMISETNADLFGRNNEIIDQSRGLADPDAMPGLLSTCSCYVYIWTLPTSYTLSILEAIVAGAPVIAPSQDLIRRLMKERDWGFDADRYEIASLLQGHHMLVYNDYIEAKNIISSASANRDEYKNVAGGTRDAARDKFDLSRNAARWTDFFSSNIPDN